MPHRSKRPRTLLRRLANIAAAFAILTILPKPCNGQASKPHTFPNGIASYRDFFQAIGDEDEYIKAQTVKGKRPISRTDYASLFGLSNGEVQQMLALILDLQHQRAVQRKRYEDAYNQFLIAQQRGLEPVSSTPPFYGTWIDNDYELVYETWLTLRATLDETQFAQLDSYVHRGLFRGIVPPSLDATVASTPIPENVSYKTFIHHVAVEDALVNREIAEGKEPHRETYSIRASFPTAEELPVRAILLDADRQLTENHNQSLTVGRDSMNKTGMQALQLQPPPPELADLSKQRDAIIEQTKARLRQELGQESFGHLDDWIKKKYGSGKVIYLTDPRR